MHLRQRLPTPSARPASVLLPLLALLASGPALDAQEPAAGQEEAEPGAIAGTVLEKGTDRPLAGAAVAVDGEVRALAGPDGRFRIEDVEPGGHRLTVEFLGFRAARSGVEVKPGETAGVRLAPERAVVEVAELVVELPSRREPWVRQAFRRIFRAGGQVYTHRDFDRMGLSYLDGLFRRIAGYQLVGDVSGAASPRFRGPTASSVLLRVHGRTCPVRLYLDGGAVPASYLKRLPVEHVAAVAFAASSQSVLTECGVISVLTRS